MPHEKPILMSAPMVRAILEGRKTQTRRIVKPQPPAECPVFVGYTTASTCSGDVGKFVWAESASPLLRRPHRVRCPYGQPGDRLWVRETWQAIHCSTDWETGMVDDFYHAKEIPKNNADEWWSVAYAAVEPVEHPDDRGFPWRPSIHMPRWASRLTLEVTKIRVERLQDITEADAEAEGVEGWNEPTGGDDYQDVWRNYLMTPAEADKGAQHFNGDPVKSYHSLWESINGSGSWGLSPWVLVVEFSLLEGGA